MPLDGADGEAGRLPGVQVEGAPRDGSRAGEPIVHGAVAAGELQLDVPFPTQSATTTRSRSASIGTVAETPPPTGWRRARESGRAVGGAVRCTGASSSAPHPDRAAEAGTTITAPTTRQ
ncbi:hypothetical protein MOPEL_007_00300 [Mobilicoccus pelagius NBRC 104925]|uniref:Uncharacterized protein n=1 Tax=Mobilicoccus pelagius NBRC 104925 TaxID=1089455 RepID=H5UNA5_9MICO|nr:hypothetical protein MOPEL_007_00300 [Mobilicoccus pelagius NBRC 104925]